MIPGAEKESTSIGNAQRAGKGRAEVGIVEQKLEPLWISVYRTNVKYLGAEKKCTKHRIFKQYINPGLYEE